MLCMAMAIHRKEYILVWHVACGMWRDLFSLKFAPVRPSIWPSFTLSSRKHGVRKLVMSSSPSTRFDGNDINGLKEDDLVVPEKFLEASKTDGTDGAKNFTKCYTVFIAPRWPFVHNIICPGLVHCIAESLFTESDECRLSLALRREQSEGRDCGVKCLIG